MQNVKGQILGHMLAPGQKLFDFAQTGAKAFFCQKEHIETILSKIGQFFIFTQQGLIMWPRAWPMTYHVK